KKYLHKALKGSHEDIVLEDDKEYNQIDIKQAELDKLTIYPNIDIDNY
ncbi:36413_t:CDS:1, partial [Racocetra persica]